jgi:hypothetical protein
VTVTKVVHETPQSRMTVVTTVEEWTHPRNGVPLVHTTTEMSNN